MSIRYRCLAANVRASPAVCENPISTSATAATATVPAWSHSSSTSGRSSDGQPARHVADQRDAALAEVQQPGRQQPADDQHEGARDARARSAAARRRRPATMAPTSTVARWVSPSVPSQDHSSWNGFEPRDLGAGELRSSPMTTSIAAPNRKPVTTARDRNCAIQPILNTASSRNRTPETSVIPATNDATSSLVGDPAADDRTRGDGRQPRARAPSRSVGRSRRRRTGWRPPRPRTGRSGGGCRRCPA